MSDHPHSDPTETLPASDELDAGLAVAFGGAPPLSAGQSVLTAFGAILPAIPRIQLRQPDGDPETPVQRPGSTEMPVLPANSDRYQLHGEIARGGMGAILKGHDADLGRDIAIKVLLETHKGRNELTQRFIEEAQIGGQLQHPNIVPIYEMGQFPDQRPYFTMKLIKGQTLARHLAQRDDPTQDRSRFLKDFEKVCQAIAFAHSKGVIHRDIKPANIMIGNFGEVQVMDWGLAKVLAEGGLADEKKARAKQEDVSVIRTVRSEGSDELGVGTQTLAGTVLGTPAYMSPEQALGDAAEVDERTDVFGLGAILCEILTGKPPYASEGGSDLFRKARRGDLSPALARLDACEADAELIELTKRCLAPEAKHRPRDADVLAKELTAYLESVEARLRQSEVERARTEAKSIEERKRRRVMRALMAALLVIFLGGSGFWLVHKRESELRELKLNRDVADTLGRADVLREQGKDRPTDPQRLTSLRELARQAQGLQESGHVDPALTGRVEELLVHLEAEERKRKLWDDIDQARLVQTSFDPERKQLNYADGVRLYREAFARFGLPAGEGDSRQAAERIRTGSPLIREALVAALDEWITMAGKAENKIEEPHLDWLREVVKAADPDPWRQQVRAAAEEKDAGRRRESLVRLAANADVARQPVLAVLNLSRSLDEKAHDSKLRLLQRAVARYPDDFWVHTSLGEALLPRSFGASNNRQQAEQAIRHFTAALALRPKDALVHSNTGYALLALQQFDEAERAFRRSIELESRSYRAHNGLGIVLGRLGKPEQARKVYEAALPLAPNDAALSGLWNNIGTTYPGDLRTEREAAYRKAIKLDGRNYTSRRNLAHLLVSQKKPDEALKELRDAASLVSEAESQMSFGQLYQRMRRYGEAITCYRRVTQLTPTDADAFERLGAALLDNNQTEQAVTALHHSLKLRADDPGTMELLGEALRKQGQTDDAARILRKAHALRTGSDLPLALAVIDFLEIHEADAETLQTWIDTLPSLEYRPASVGVRPGSSPPRFNAIAIRDGRRIPWSMDWTRNLAETGVIHNQRISDGYRKVGVIDLLDRPPAEQLQVQIFWKDGLPWDLSVGMRSDTWNAPNSPDEATARRNALRPIFCYSPLGKRPARTFSAYDAPDEGLEWASHFDLSLEELVTRVKEVKKQGWRPDGLQVLDSENGPAFQLLPVSNPTQATWEFRHDLTSAELEATMAEQKQLGRRPLSVVSYGEDRNLRFAAVWLEYKPSLEVVAVSEEQLKSPKYHNARGLLALHHKKPEEAVAAFRKAVELDATFEPALVNLGRSLIQDQPAEAQSLFEKVLKVHPGSAEAHQGMADCRLRLGENELAELWRRKAKALKDGSVNPLSVVDFRHSLSSTTEELKAWVDALPPGFRPESITPQVGSQPQRFNAIAIRDRHRWPFHVGWRLGNPKVQSEVSGEPSGEGMRQSIACPYWHDGIEMTHQVRVRDGQANYGFGIARSAVAATLTTWRIQGYRPLGPHYGFKDRNVGFIMEADRGLDWQSFVDLSAEEVAAKVQEARERGWRPDALNITGDENAWYHLLVLVSNPLKVGWEFRADLTRAEFEKVTKEQHALGRRPMSIISRGDGDATRYTAVWLEYLAALEKRPDPLPGAGLKPGEKRNLYVGTQVASVALHPDGRTLLVGSRTDPYLVSRDTDTGRRVRVFSGYLLPCLSVSWTRDGKQAAAGSGTTEGWLNTWNPVTGHVMATLVTSLGEAVFVEYSRDGKFLVSAHAGPSVRLSEVEGLKPIRTFTFPKDTAVTRAAFSPDGKRLLMTTSTKSLRIDDVASGKVLLTIEAPLAGQVGAWLPDNRIITGGKDGFVRLWDDRSGKELTTWDAGSEVTHLAVSPDGKRLLTSHTKEKAVRLWDIATKEKLVEFEEAGELHRAVFSPDGKLAVVGSDAGFLHVYGLPK